MQEKSFYEIIGKLYVDFVRAQSLLEEFNVRLTQMNEYISTLEHKRTDESPR